MADCVWCEKRDIHAEPPCEWVKANINSLEEDFTSPFPCSSLKEMYDDGDWGVTPEPPSPYPFTLFTSGASGELVISQFGNATSESPAVYEYELQDGDNFRIEATLEGFVLNGSEPTTYISDGIAYNIEQTLLIDFPLIDSALYVNLNNGDTTITVVGEGGEDYTLSWTSLHVNVVGERN